MYARHFLLVLAFCTPCLLFAQDAEPVLRLETGMHNARSSSISTDAGGHYILSCSDDKTARLWEAATGRLINILRVPIGQGDQGKLYAGALNADATIAAVGGQTRKEEAEECIYLLNSFTGEVIKSLCGLPDIVNKLEFSPDGRWLAVGLGDGGVIVYNTQTWQQKVLPGNYNGQVYGLSFSKDGRLATACYDGYVRVYTAEDFFLTAATDNPGGEKPYSVAFDASGEYIAVGYSNQPMVIVCDAGSLSPAYMPDLSGIPENEDVSSVCFTSSNTLYAGGSFEKNTGAADRKYIVRSWQNGGRSAPQDWLLLDNTVMSIKALPDGKLAVDGSYPDMALVEPSGNTAWYKKADNLNIAGSNPDFFKISPTGDAVSLLMINGEQLNFSVDHRSLSQHNTMYYAPVKRKGFIQQLSGGTAYAAINNVAIKLMAKEEICRASAITQDAKKIAWVGDFNLYLTDQTGQLLWKKSLPETGFAVNIAPENNVITVALGDGTIRWYSIGTGDELLALYLSADRQHWILFTPKGYYDASPGAEDLLGWHVNNGLDKAPYFFPLSRFKQAYYRPDIIDVLLLTGDENKAIQYANTNNNRPRTDQKISAQNLPPTIMINSPVSGSTINSDTVTINYTIHTAADAPVSSIQVKVDGRPVTIAQRGMQPRKDSSHTVIVNVPKHSCTVTLLAGNAYGLSPSADLFLTYNDQSPQQKEREKPVLYLLAIGVSDYANPVYKLNYAAVDAQDFSTAFNTQKGVFYKDVVVKCLTDQAATRENMEDAFDWIRQSTTRNDVAMIFFAGHGVNDNSGFFYMAPAGADMGKLRSTCVNFTTLTQTITTIPGKVIVFIDACHSGDITGGSKYSTDINGVANELSNAQNGSIVFTSSTGREFSMEDLQLKHGFFTKTLLDGLKGAALFGNDLNEITVKSLDLYITRMVKKLTGGKQNPTTVVPPNVPDFTICVVK